MPDLNSHIPYLAIRKPSGLFIVTKSSRRNGKKIKLYRVSTHDRQDAHKLSALIQNLVNDNIVTYEHTNNKIYNPFTHTHLNQDFIEKYFSFIVANQQFHDESIEIKIQRLQRQVEQKIEQQQIDVPQNVERSISEQQNPEMTEEPIIQAPVIDKLKFSQSLNHENFYDLHKTSIRKQFKLVNKVKQCRAKIIHDLAGTSFLITDQRDVGNITNAMVQNLCEPKVKDRKIKIRNRYIKQTDVVAPKKCTENYRIPKLAGQFYLESKINIPSGTVIGCYNFKCFPTEVFNQLHAHPETLLDHKAYAFEIKLYPLDDEKVRELASNQKFSTSLEEKIDKLIKAEKKAACKLGLNYRQTTNETFIKLTIDPHCHFQGSIANCKTLKNRLMTLINDCRNDLDLLNLTEDDTHRQNVEFTRVEVNGWEFVFIVATKDIQPHTEIAINYGTDYSDASSGKTYFRQIVAYVNTMADKYTIQ